MTHYAPPSRVSGAAVPLPQVLEEHGLSTFRTNQRPQHDALSNPTVLQAAADVLRARLPRHLLDPFAPSDVRNEAVAAVLRAAISEARQTGSLLGQLPTDMDSLRRVFAATIGWGPAQRYLDDPRIVEVKIVGTAIMVQEIGQPFVRVPEHFMTTAEVSDRAKNMADLLHVPLDASQPQQTLPLEHGTRMHVSIYPCTINGPLVCIRRGRTYPWNISDLLGRGAMDEPTARLLQLLCRAKASVLVVGATGSGKTAMLEALANSWEGEHHVLTIQDNCSEIQIKPDLLWTSEIVNTSKDPHDFSIKAREALRQTPGLCLAGETRSHEAGAILSLPTSDHPTMTTIHALSGADGLERFASCAALPHAYMYEGRRNDALRDVTAAFDAVIVVEFLPAQGRRVVREIVFANGVRETVGGLMADVIPVVELDVNDEGELRWKARAHVVGDELRWTDGGGAGRMPRHLAHKLQRVRTTRSASSAAPSVDVATQAMRRAEGLIAGGQAQRALEALRDAWTQRQDIQILRVAQRAVAMLGNAAVKTEADALTTELFHSIDHGRWSRAAQQLTSILSHLEYAAAAVPPTGWESIQRQIEAAQQAQRRATQVLESACELLTTRQLRLAVSQLDTLDPYHRLLEPTMLYLLMEVRVEALRKLAERGDADPQAVESTVARLEALRQIVAADRQADTTDGGTA